MQQSNFVTKIIDQDRCTVLVDNQIDWMSQNRRIRMGFYFHNNGTMPQIHLYGDHCDKLYGLIRIIENWSLDIEHPFQFPQKFNDSQSNPFKNWTKIPLKLVAHNNQ